jgi:hypothetical protein
VHHQGPRRGIPRGSLSRAEYTDTRLTEGDADAKPLIWARGNNNLTEGYISLQSESHPVEFRNIEVMELKAE